jgi:hypothetical protein
MRSALLALGFFLASIAPAVAHAQMTYIMPPPLSTLGYVNGMVFGETWAEENRRAAEQQALPFATRAVPRIAPDQRPTPKASPASLSFTVSLARRRTTLERIVADYVRINPGAGPELRQQLIESGDFFPNLDQALAPFGYRTTNLADAYSVFWINAWEAANGVTDSQTSRSQAQAVKRQVEEILLAIPQTAQLSDADKQAFSEVLLVQAIMIQTIAQQPREGAQSQAQFQASVRQIGISLGFDLDKFKLTQTGFELAD